MTKALAAQAPIWPPGTQPAYHIRTFGFLVGEIIRRVTGKHFGQFYRDEIAAPLGIDFQFGVDPERFPALRRVHRAAGAGAAGSQFDVRARGTAMAGAARLQRAGIPPRRDSLIERPWQCARGRALLFDPRQWWPLRRQAGAQPCRARYRARRAILGQGSGDRPQQPPGARLSAQLAAISRSGRARVPLASPAWAVRWECAIPIAASRSAM